MNMQVNDTTKIISAIIDNFGKTSSPHEINFRKIIQINNLDRYSHFIHPYPAKLLQHIPIFFLSNNLLSKKGDTVYDPFCGSGTVVLESILHERNAIGIDTNPFATLLSNVKCTIVNPEKVSNEFIKIKKIYKTNKNLNHDVVNADYWYSLHIKNDLASLSNVVNQIEDVKIRDFIKICISYTARKLSYADPRISVPVKINPKKYPEGHRLRLLADKHLNDISTKKTIDVLESVIEANIKRISTLPSKIKNSVVTIENENALYYSKKNIEGKVQLIITSPPYPGAQKYIRSSSFSLGWLHLCPSHELICLKKRTIGREEVNKKDYYGEYKDLTAQLLLNDIFKINPTRAVIAGSYLTEMNIVIKNCSNILKKNGWLVLIAANNTFCGIEFPTQKFLVDMATNAGLSLKAQIVDDIKSYGLMTKRNKTSALISCEWVHIFQKS